MYHSASLIPGSEHTWLQSVGSRVLDLVERVLIDMTGGRGAGGGAKGWERQ